MAEVLNIRANRGFDPYMAIAFIYFFLNCLFLPEGLQYTTMLTPLFLWYAFAGKEYKPFVVFFFIADIYTVVHISLGVNAYFYLRSLLLAFCSFSFAIAVHVFLQQNKSPDKLFEKIAMANMILIPIAIICLFMHPINEYFWYYKPISPGVKSFPRLSMLTYEASYYSLLFTPVFLYYFISVLLNKTNHPVLALLAVIIPLALSLSFGGIAVIVISMLVAFLLQYKNILDSRQKRLRFFYLIATSIALAVIILYVFPANPIAKRIFNIFNNNDTSIKGRTYDSFILAWRLAGMKSHAWGVGFGQIKVLGHEMIVNYYKYYDAHPVIRIPNSSAETLAMFGTIGFILRILLELYLFARTKVYTNVYRVSIFTFVFIYQFTGSFMFNIAELLLWVLAFTAVFPQFDIVSLNKKEAQ